MLLNVWTTIYRVQPISCRATRYYVHRGKEPKREQRKKKKDQRGRNIGILVLLEIMRCCTILDKVVRHNSFGIFDNDFSLSFIRTISTIERSNKRKARRRRRSLLGWSLHCALCILDIRLGSVRYVPRTLYQQWTMDRQAPGRGDRGIF